MVNSLILPSFSAGELSPDLYGRVDLSKWHVGLATCRNMYPRFEGGACNRPGFRFVGRARDSSQIVRLIPFIFSTVQAYMLEFGHQYMRVIMNGGYVLLPATAITGITNAQPGVVTSVAHGLAAGDWVSIAGVLGMTLINNGPYTWKVAAVIDANHVALETLDNVALDTSGFGVYTGAGTIAKVFTLATPYSGSDLPLLKYTQSADTMSLVHNSYGERALTRTAHYIWALTPVTYAAVQVAPVAGTAVTTGGTGATTHFHYVVTAIAASGEESLPSADMDTGAAGDITQSLGNVLVSWTAAAGAVSYNVYRFPVVSNGDAPAASLYGLIGTTDGVAFTDTNLNPDFSLTPPSTANPFAAGNNPGCIEYYQQRLIRGGMVNGPATINGSQIGHFNNMNVSAPTRDSDAVQYNLVSKQVNAIRWLIEMSSGFVAMTYGGAWLINGGIPPPPLTPTSITALRQTGHGAADVIPIVIGTSILYVQYLGGTVRDLKYQYLFNVFEGEDRTVLSRHLFPTPALAGANTYQIVDWCYADLPHKLVWAVRGDGKLLTMTYLPEQQIYGWARHDSPSGDGHFLAIATIPESPEDAVYAVVQRTVPGVNNGAVVQYIERLHTRSMVTPWGPGTYGNPTPDPKVGDVNQAFFVDSGATYGPTVISNAACTPSAVSGTITLTSNGFPFVAADAGNGVAPGGTGSIVRINGGVCQIIGFTSTQQVTAKVINGPGPDPGVYWLPTQQPALRDTTQAQAGEWTKTTTVSTLYGLYWLEGLPVTVLNMGSVEGPYTVANGQITLSQPGDVVAIGLPYTGQFKSLELDPPGQAGGTSQVKRLMTPRLGIKVADTRGLKAGRTFNTMVELKERSALDFPGQPVPLFSGPPDEYVVLEPGWTAGSQVCLQQDYPLPCTILALVPEITVGDSPG